MRSVVITLILALALAGCVNEGDVDVPPEPGTAPDTASHEEPGTPTTGTPPSASNATLITIPVDFNGNLGTGVMACETDTVGQCQSQAVSPTDNGVLVPAPDTILRTVNLTLTWSAATPATQTLAFYVMVMGENNTMIDSVEGTSPLVLQIDGLDLAVPGSSVVHAFTFNPELFVHNPPLIAQVRLDQPFTIAGTLVVESSADPVA